ncbi:unnamed protein product, partial [Amoebophrya sp. A25]
FKIPQRRSPVKANSVETVLAQRETADKKQLMSSTGTEFFPSGSSSTSSTTTQNTATVVGTTSSHLLRPPNPKLSSGGTTTVTSNMFPAKEQGSSSKCSKTGLNKALNHL